MPIDFFFRCKLMGRVVAETMLRPPAPPMGGGAPVRGVRRVAGATSRTRSSQGDPAVKVPRTRLDADDLRPAPKHAEISVRGGQPQFAPIGGTGLQYGRITGSDLLFVPRRQF